MRRFSMLGCALFLFALMLGAYRLPVSAQAPPDVTHFAHLFPDEVNVYASLRTDAGYFETLDGLLTHIQSRFPISFDVGETIRSQLARNLPKADFDFATDMRPWLGDSIAFGIATDVEGNDPAIIVGLEITDREAALDFLNETLFTDTEVQAPVQMGRYDVYVPEAEFLRDQAVGLSDDTLIVIGSLPYDVIFSGDFGDSVAETDAFQAAVAVLPESSYNGLIYADIAFNRQTTPIGVSELLLLNLVNLPNPLAVGFTIQDGNTLIADLAVVNGDGSTNTTVEDAPLDPAFTARIPANASMVVQGDSLGGVIRRVIDGFRAEMRSVGMSDADMDAVMEDVTATLMSLTGADLETELIPALDGNFAAFTRYTLIEPGAPQLFAALLYPGEVVPINVGFGILIDANDPALVDNTIQSVLSLSGAPLVSETIGDTEVAVLPIPLNDNVPMTLDIVFALQDNLVIVATRAEAEAILAGEGGFDAAAGYVEATQYALPNPISFTYMDRNGLTLFFDLFLGLMGPTVGEIYTFPIPAQDATPIPTRDPMAVLREQREQLAEFQRTSQSASRILSSSSISTAVSENGINMRFALTLAD